jgi:hypothetical protein
MAAVLRRRKMREGFAPCLNSQEKAASYAGNQFPQHLTLSQRGLPSSAAVESRSDPSEETHQSAWRSQAL